MLFTCSIIEDEKIGSFSGGMKQRIGIAQISAAFTKNFSC
jgi:ABC-type multidrug transport system ATPase subunit